MNSNPLLCVTSAEYVSNYTLRLTFSTGVTGGQARCEVLNV